MSNAEKISDPFIINNEIILISSTSLRRYKIINGI